MLDKQEIAQINQELKDGEVLADIAQRRNLTREGLRIKLLEAGWRIRIHRELVQTSDQRTEGQSVGAGA